MKEVVSARQHDLTLILENVHDPHNIGAVLRTCDAVGVAEIYLICTDQRLQEKGVDVGHKTSSGAKKWIKINSYQSVESCFAAVRAKYHKIYGTGLGHDAQTLYDLPLSSSCALLFGNEHGGLSQEAMNAVDGNFIIPQFGFVQSLNISVACAVSLYEACRQRIAASAYSGDFGERPQDQPLLDRYIANHEQARIDKITYKKKKKELRKDNI